LRVKGTGLSTTSGASVKGRHKEIFQVAGVMAIGDESAWAVTVAKDAGGNGTLAGVLQAHHDTTATTVPEARAAAVRRHANARRGSAIGIMTLQNPHIRRIASEHYQPTPGTIVPRCLD